MKKFLLLILLAGGLFPLNLNAQAAAHVKKGPVGISGWVIFWDEGNKSLQAFEKHANQMDRAYFEWYHMLADGMPAPVTQATEPLKARAMAAAIKNGVEPWFMIGNYNPEIGDHDAAWVEKFLYNGALQARHIQALIDFAKRDRVAGIQVDYENLKAKDRDPFSHFMGDLSRACKANGLQLGIAVHSKVDAEGTWDGPKAHDYQALGKVVDQFAPMTYDEHWPTSQAGCIGAPEYAETVDHFAASVVNPAKIEVGVPTYGYDWVGNHGDSLTWDQFQGILAKYNVTPARDTDYSQELHVNYPGNHNAWIPDENSFEFKADIAKRYRFYGVTMWYIGCEGPAFWDMVKKVNSTLAETAKAAVPTGQAAKPAVQEFLTDTMGGSYAYAYPEGQATNVIIDKQGKRWADIVMKGTAWSGAGIGVDRKNLEPLMKTGALQFYVRGAKGGEAINVGFIMSKGMKEDEKVSLETSIPLNNYAQLTTHWQLVTIPLADFSPSGFHYDETIGQQVHGTFKWNRVVEFVIEHAPSADPTVEIQLSSIRVIPSYNPKMVARELNATQN